MAPPHMAPLHMAPSGLSGDSHKQLSSHSSLPMRIHHSAAHNCGDSVNLWCQSFRISQRQQQVPVLGPRPLSARCI